MPYINVRMTAPLTPEKESALTAAFGRDIEAFPGKTERWLMVDYTGDCHMHFGRPLRYGANRPVRKGKSRFLR